jgi:hypothetical protein
VNTAFKPLSWAFVLAVTTGIATAQETPTAAPTPAAAPAIPGTSAGGRPKAASKSTAQIDAGEPRANTSPTSVGNPASGVPASAGPPAAAPAAGTAPAGISSPRTPARAAAAAGRSPGAAGQKAPGAADRLELGTATVTGDREQPKVMYIVPWKKSDIGVLSGKPMHSLLDEALAPIDRDEFRREVAYYDVVKSDTSQNGAPNPASKQGEK